MCSDNVKIGRKNKIDSDYRLQQNKAVISEFMSEAFGIAFDFFKCIPEPGAVVFYPGMDQFVQDYVGDQFVRKPYQLYIHQSLSSQ